VWCWGANGVGQLGDGTTRELQKAVRVRASRRGPAFTGARRVATGFGYSCSIQRNATVRCWGWNEYGQIGDRTFSLSRPFPTAVTQYPRPRLRDVVQLAAGTAHTCAVVRDGSAWCWGTNGSGELGGVSTTPRIATAVRVRFPESAER
jgi:alpha-tubulin suppressor-like RCC1 family protein